MMQKLIDETKSRMDKVIEMTKRELGTLRTGRANPSLLDRVEVEAYGSRMPLNQVAMVSVPEPRMIVVQPYDKSTISAIDKAIRIADLGLNPSSDGSILRISIPALTEERRKELVKLGKKISEDMKIAVRNVRRDSNDELKKLEKDNQITEDDQKKGQNDVQKLTDDYITKIDSLLAEKEKEIMEV
ncbi:MAG: ribosome recycling factor [Firmicutes bacterium]|nr:ribosome recycling factor [Bacillota bacterium]MDD4693955.1 ribosome recycling factor [Bacillota bacterium]